MATLDDTVREDPFSPYSTIVKAVGTFGGMGYLAYQTIEWVYSLGYGAVAATLAGVGGGVVGAIAGGLLTFLPLVPFYLITKKGRDYLSSIGKSHKPPDQNIPHPAGHPA